MRHFSILILVLFCGSIAHAQIFGNAGFAVGTDASMITLGAAKQFNLGKKDKFHINPGVRFNIFNGSNLDYLTAPADLTADEANMDTFTLGSVQNNFANLYIQFKYDLSRKFSIGFDIDLIGVSFGAEHKGDYKPGLNASKAGLSKINDAPSAPTGVNYLIMGDLDHGSLNSTLTISYSLNDKLGIDLGGGLVFTEYTTTNAIGVESNDRFRNKNFMGFLGLSYMITN